MIDVTPLSEIGGKAYEDLYRECDPNYATSGSPAGEACVLRMDATLQKIAPNNPHFVDSPELKAWTSDCSGKMSLQQRDRASAIAQKYDNLRQDHCEEQFKHIITLFDNGTATNFMETITKAGDELKAWQNGNCTITGAHNKTYQAKFAEFQKRVAAYSSH